MKSRPVNRPGWQGIEFIMTLLLVGQLAERTQINQCFQRSPGKKTGRIELVGARIFAVADAVDAMTSDRPYRAGRSFDDAADELIRCAGAHFDPGVVAAFNRVPIDS